MDSFERRLTQTRTLQARPPVATLVVALTLSASSVFVTAHPEAGVISRVFGAIPVEVLRGQDLWSLLTSGFLHFQIGHLMPNILILIVAGTYVELRLGYVFMTWVLVIAVMAGALAHCVTYPESTIPLFGMSAGALALTAAAVADFTGRWFKGRLREVFVLTLGLGACLGLMVHLRPAFSGGVPMPANLLESDIAHSVGIGMGILAYAIFTRIRGSHNI